MRLVTLMINGARQKILDQKNKKIMTYRMVNNWWCAIFYKSYDTVRVSAIVFVSSY